VFATGLEVVNTSDDERNCIIIIVSILDFIGAKGDGDGSGNWSYKTCKAPVKSSSSTNQHLAFYRPDVLPVTQPTGVVY